MRIRLPRHSRRYRWQVRAAGALGARLLRLLGATWQLHFSGPDPFARDPRFVGAIWHRGMLAAAFAWRDRGLAIPVSKSRDGDLVDRVLHHLGFAESLRGSSSRHASSLLRALVRRVRAGATVFILPDGPLGPAGEAKLGAVALAGATGAPLVPVGIASSRPIVFSSWDRTILPLPFAHVCCLYGDPLLIPSDATDAEQEALRQRLGKELGRLDAEAAALLAARR